jgi:serine/threonine protein kinase
MWKRQTSGAELQPGDVFGPFRLDRVLGRGGMGIVFRATRLADGEVVALKVLRGELSGDAVFRRRFLHEARAAGSVTNRHLVPIVDAGEVDGHQYLAARCVDGISLEQRIRAEGALPVGDVVRMVAEIASGLDALHAAGLVHRDVKPANIMLDESRGALLTDFGLSKGRAYTVLTEPGSVMGTVDYLAPELIRGGAASPATDIYALGCAAHECLTGAPPFAASEGVVAIGLAHLNDDPPDPSAHRRDVPAEVSWAVLQALAKAPERRPPTATAYSRALSIAARAHGGGDARRRPAMPGNPSS